MSAEWLLPIAEGLTRMLLAVLAAGALFLLAQGVVCGVLFVYFWFDRDARSNAEPCWTPDWRRVRSSMQDQLALPQVTRW